jgi:putative Holliday junction resolvase
VGEILDRARSLEAEGFVVGLPLDQEGEETERSAEARRVAANSRNGADCVRGCRRALHDRAAQRAIKEMGGSTRGRKGDVDALAATVLLQLAPATAGADAMTPACVRRRVVGRGWSSH